MCYMTTKPYIRCVIVLTAIMGIFPLAFAHMSVKRRELGQEFQEFQEFIS